MEKQFHQGSIILVTLLDYNTQALLHYHYGLEKGNPQKFSVNDLKVTLKKRNKR